MILATKEVNAANLKVISATTKVILVTKKVVSATDKASLLGQYPFCSGLDTF